MTEPTAPGGPGSARFVADVGEFGLIDRIVALLQPSSARILGPGDDAAVLAAPDGRVVATVDVLVEGTHFRRDWSSAYDVGRKAAAASLADVAAMGATATTVLVGLACPPDLPLDWAESLARGLSDEAGVVGAGVEGGDVVAAPLVCLSVTALGDLAGLAPVTRTGARVGDLVVLVGQPGRSAAGLALLRAGLGPSAPELVAAHRRPEPPYAAGPVLAAAGATAMIDVSDGLLADLAHVCRCSDVVIDLRAAALPLPDLMRAAATTTGANPLDWILTGGEDHILAATVPSGWLMPPSVASAGGRVVGVVAGAGAVGGAGPVTVDGLRPVLAGRTGWDHFA